VKDYDVQCGLVNGYASLGNEYEKQAKGGSLTVLSAINALPGNHEAAMKNLTQRIKEIDPSFSRNSLDALLKSQQLIDDEFDYLIYPKYNTADNTNPKIVISPRSNAQASWLNRNSLPDGGTAQVGSELLEDDPNSSWAQVRAKPNQTRPVWKLDDKHVKVTGKIMWTPGSGYNQCLGMVSFDR
jgi:hypothetical protein